MVGLCSMYSVLTCRREAGRVGGREEGRDGGGCFVGSFVPWFVLCFMISIRSLLLFRAYYCSLRNKMVPRR